MCIEDYRLGRKTRTAYSFVACPNGINTPICGFSKNRVHLRISRNANAGWVAPAGFPMDANVQGIALNNSDFPVDVDIKDHGEMVTQQWMGRGNAGTLNVFVIETFLDDQ